MNSIVPKNRLYDAAKIIATILVVVAHATRMYTPNGAVPAANDSAFLHYVTDYIYVFHMPLFMLLSGCVYGYCIEQQKYSNTLAFVCSKGKRLLIPYFSFGVLYVAPVMCALGLTGESYLGYVFHGILLSYNSRHLWYIMALFWIFVIYIFLRPLIFKGNRGLVFVGGFSVLLFLMARVVPHAFQLSAACSYQFFFFLGVLFNRLYADIHRIFSKCRVVGYLLPLASLMMFVFNPNSLTAYVYKGIGIVMVLFLCWCLLSRYPDILEHPVFCTIKQYSFGIYLFHPMIIYVLFYVFGKYNINPVVLSLAVIAIAIILPIYSTKLLYKLRLQWLVGG